MTFEEALDLKNNTNLNDHLDLPNPFILVVPLNSNDLELYMEGFIVDPKIDERAKLFSRNNEFGVFIFYQFDISITAHRDITIR